MGSFDLGTGEPTAWTADLGGGFVYALRLRRRPPVRGRRLHVDRRRRASRGSRRSIRTPASSTPAGRRTRRSRVGFPKVYALAVQGANLVVGGSFTTIGGQPRDDLATIDRSHRRGRRQLRAERHARREHRGHRGRRRRQRPLRRRRLPQRRRLRPRLPRGVRQGRRRDVVEPRRGRPGRGARQARHDAVRRRLLRDHRRPGARQPGGAGHERRAARRRRAGRERRRLQPGGGRRRARSSSSAARSRRSRGVAHDAWRRSTSPTATCSAGRPPSTAR